VKQDALPAKYTDMWFEATKIGTFPIFCAEYCGTEHSLMGGTVTVMSQDDYQEWLQLLAGSSPSTTSASASCT
jgi:cytochrome c oxidase subunit 2